MIYGLQTPCGVDCIYFTAMFRWDVCSVLYEEFGSLRYVSTNLHAVLRKGLAGFMLLFARD